MGRPSIKQLGELHGKNRYYLCLTLVGVVAGCATYFLCRSVVLLVATLADADAFHYYLTTENPKFSLAFAAAAVIVAPPIEEYIFRKKLYCAIRSIKNSTVASIAIASSVFALFHLLHAGYIGVLAVFLLGASCNVFYVIFGRLYIAILIHSSYNLLNSILWSPPVDILSAIGVKGNCQAIALIALAAICSALILLGVARYSRSFTRPVDCDTNTLDL